MTRKKIILVVDAEPVTRKMLMRGLDPAYFSVEECLTGKAAAELSAALNPDLVLLDFDLPDMAGNDVIASLRPWLQAPIIILTVRPASPEVLTAFSLGADDCLARPFHLSELEGRINAKIRRHEYWLRCRGEDGSEAAADGNAGALRRRAGDRDDRPHGAGVSSKDPPVAQASR